MTVGILVPVLADGYHAEVMTGIGDRLLKENYFYFIAHHRHRTDLIEQYPRMLISRGAEGLIAIDTHLVHKLPLPVVAIAGHRRMGRSPMSSRSQRGMTWDRFNRVMKAFPLPMPTATRSISAKSPLATG